MVVVFFYLMLRRLRGSKLTDTLFPYTALFRSAAEAIVAGSDAGAEDLAATAQLPRSAITAIPNWVTTDVAAEAGPAPDHPWFAAGAPPLVLGVGQIGRAHV